MQTNSINPSVFPSTLPQDRIPIKTFSQDDFLKLLIAQLTSQDPLNPQKDTEFIAQLTQFSALEQSRNMQKDLETMREDQELTQASDLLGRTVMLHDPNTKNDVRGTVTEVQVDKGAPKIVVNGKAYDVEAVTMVSIDKQQPNLQIL